jgi:AbiV family abortive infection protein
LSVSADVLLKGGWYSIEECGRLLRSAVTLYSNKEYASGVALALLAREELGRYRILLELWGRRLVANKCL